MHAEVLHSARYPTARFTGRAIAEGAGFHVDGQLELAGRTTTLSFDVRRDGDVYRARFEIPPSRWGIQPYKALLGAIKLKDSVRIELALTENADYGALDRGDRFPPTPERSTRRASRPSAARRKLGIFREIQGVPRQQW